LEYFMKRSYPLLRLAVGTAAIVAGQAANADTGGTVTFSGSISSNSCKLRISGTQQTAGTVTLAKAGLTNLTASGATTGLTPVTLGLMGCTTAGAASPATAYFLLSSASVTGAGYIANTASGGATGVALQLTDSSGGTTYSLGTSDASIGPALVLGSAGTAADTVFGIRYIATQAAPVAGTVSGTLTANFSYN
jgi:major type 1 subunit fimbrin (pilin)